jgi:predicted PurR-regulated permease PerM
VPSDRRTGLTPITLLLVLVVGYLLIQIQFVLVLVLLSLVFATVIQTPVDALNRRHIPRPLAILLVYVAIIAAITVLFMLLSPAIREQATAFRQQAPQSLAD